MKELTPSEFKKIIGKTISNVDFLSSIETEDIIVVIFFTDKTFTAIAPNPDKSSIKEFIEKYKNHLLTINN